MSNIKMQITTFSCAKNMFVCFCLCCCTLNRFILGTPDSFSGGGFLESLASCRCRCRTIYSYVLSLFHTNGENKTENETENLIQNVYCCIIHSYHTIYNVIQDRNHIYKLFIVHIIHIIRQRSIDVDVYFWFHLKNRLESEKVL